MSFSLDILGLINICTDIHEQLTQKDARTARAIELVDEAVIDTYDYLKNQQGPYTSQPALAKKWSKASAAVLLVDTQLGGWLKNKSDFWLNPESYFHINRQNEVLTLEQVRGELYRLTRKIRKRK